MVEILESESVLQEGETGPGLSANPEDDRETTYLLPKTIQDDATHRKICHLLYVSHSLSAWNSRAFEFGAFLFLSAIYPQTLLPASVYALTRAGSAALLSPWLGTYVDGTERLAAVRISIIGQRFSVALSCLILYLESSYSFIQKKYLYSALFLALLCVLAIIEKLSAIMNIISIERDWVVVLAQDNESRLRTLNSQMRRIDLFCKLVGPLAISFLGAYSLRAAIAATGLSTALSIGIEYFAVAKVYRAVPALKTPRTVGQTHPSPVQATVKHRFQRAVFGTVTYFRHPAFLPSFALALLYLTVLSFAGQMITYLLSLGVSPAALGILRGAAAIFEMSATWVAPEIMKRIGPIRTGIWFLNFQLLCVSIACLFLWLEIPSIIAAVGTIGAVIASRIGLWGFDLCVQIIVQEEVDSQLRGIFSSHEFAFQNIFEMISFACTIILPRPNQFKYPAAISTGAVAVAGALYAIFVRTRRGHLIHLSQCIERPHKSGTRLDCERVRDEEHTGDNNQTSAN